MPTTEPDAVTRERIVDAVATLDRDGIAIARWFGGKGRAIERVELDDVFVIETGPPHVLAIVGFLLGDGERQRYTIALTGPDLRPARPGDGAWRALALAMWRGEVVPALPRTSGAPPQAALVCRPGRAMPADGPGAERDLGADQSNTSVILGETLLLKVYRRLQPGLNPDLEMTAFLSEDAGFAAVPQVAGYAELVEAGREPTTVAMAQTFITEGADAYETIADTLATWLLAPGSVSLEYATEVAADLGTLTAGMHAAVADAHGVQGMGPRPATRDEVRAWGVAAAQHLEHAVEVAPADHGAADTLRELAPAAAAALTVIDAMPSTPEVIRAHGDFHLGQVLIAPDGFRVIDFEGEPLSTPDERRAHRHPLRDVASMLRSIDHVGRSAGRRAVGRNGGPLEHAGLDLDGWLLRARERYLEAYRAGLLDARVMPSLDPDLLHAFEVDKELYEFAYAATYLPSWLWAPTEGLRGLLGDASHGEGGGLR